MTRVQQMLLHRRKLKYWGNLISVVLSTPTHFSFTPSKVILKNEPNVEARFKIEGKAFLNKIITVYILQLYASKPGQAVCYEHLLWSTFWSRSWASLVAAKNWFIPPHWYFLENDISPLIKFRYACQVFKCHYWIRFLRFKRFHNRLTVQASSAKNSLA